MVKGKFLFFIMTTKAKFYHVFMPEPIGKETYQPETKVVLYGVWMNENEINDFVLTREFQKDGTFLLSNRRDIPW